jgi:hypothetical protein
MAKLATERRFTSADARWAAKPAIRVTRGVDRYFLRVSFRLSPGVNSEAPFVVVPASRF